jgi:hypothetical protein
MRIPKSLLFSAAAFVVVGTAAACGGDGGAVTAPDRPARLLTNQPPVAVVNLTVLGPAGCGPGACWYDYEYDADQSYDPDGSIVSYEWKLNSGYVHSTTSHWYVEALRAYEGCSGTQRGKLIVTDNAGAADTACFGYTPVN